MKVSSPLHDMEGPERKISVLLDAKSVRHLETVRAALALREEGETRASVSRAVRAALRLWVKELAKGDESSGK